MYVYRHKVCWSDSSQLLTVCPPTLYIYLEGSTFLLSASLNLIFEAFIKKHNDPTTTHAVSKINCLNFDKKKCKFGSVYGWRSNASEISGRIMWSNNYVECTLVK